MADSALKRGQYVDLRLTLLAPFQYKTQSGDHEPDCVFSVSAENVRGDSGYITVGRDTIAELGRVRGANAQMFMLGSYLTPYNSIRRRESQ